MFRVILPQYLHYWIHIASPLSSLATKQTSQHQSLVFVNAITTTAISLYYHEQAMVIRSALKWLPTNQHCAKLRTEMKNSYMEHFDNVTKNSFPTPHRLGHDLYIYRGSLRRGGKCTFSSFQAANFHPRAPHTCQHIS